MNTSAMRVPSPLTAKPLAMKKAQTISQIVALPNPLSATGRGP